MSKYKKHRNPIHVLGMCVFNVLFRRRKIDQNKVFFLNFSHHYDCNPKYICEEFCKKGLDVKLVFVLDKNNATELSEHKNIKIVQKGTSEFYKEIYSSKVIVENDVKSGFLGFHKKKGQILFETWHGSIGIKLFGKDANDDKLWHKMARRTAKMTDFVISNSDFESNIYRKTFWEKNEILKYGHPRNDIFFITQDKISAIKEKISNFYKIKCSNKLCLYAPTFRDENRLDVYSMDFSKLSKALKEKFGGDWTILLRYHHTTNLNGDNSQSSNDVVDVSNYPDIQELLAVIDCGITDYSSWICEYVLRKQPGFIYAPDADEYRNNERKLAIPLEELPFPLATNMENLLQNISTFNIINYVKECDMFLKKHGSVDDGQASKRVVKKIEELIK